MQEYNKLICGNGITTTSMTAMWFVNERQPTNPNHLDLPPGSIWSSMDSSGFASTI